VDFCNGGWGCIKSLKVLKVEVKVIFSVLACFGHISIKIILKINRERRERRFVLEKIEFWAYKNHGSAAVTGRAPGATSLDPLVLYNM